MADNTVSGRHRQSEMSSFRPQAILRTFAARAVVTDCIAVALVAAAVALISPTRSPSGEVPTEPLVWSLAFSLTVVVVAALRGDYRSPLRPELTEVFRQAAGTTTVTALTVLTARVFLADDAYVAAETTRHWLMALPFLIALRGALLWREARVRRHGDRLAPTLIVGAGFVGQRVATRLLDEPEIGLQPVAFLDKAGQAKAQLPVHLFDEDVESLLERYGIRHAIFAFAYGGDSTMPALARRLWAAGVTVKVVPRLFELGGERTALTFLGAMPVATLRPVRHDGLRMRAKYALDRVVAATAIAALAPLLVAVALAVRIALGRPVLFRQMRVGNDGRHFEMLKFRTMRPAGEGQPEADADWASKHLGTRATASSSPPADRSTRLGDMLRQSSLDELPQLFNVVRGDMSLIGPRPERVAYAEAFGQTVRGYSDRQRVKSGLTGWAQVSGLRGQTSLDDRVEWDNHYIEHWSPWLDLKILLLTVPQLLRRPGA